MYDVYYWKFGSTQQYHRVFASYEEAEAFGEKVWSWGPDWDYMIVEQES